MALKIVAAQSNGHRTRTCWRVGSESVGDSLASVQSAERIQLLEFIFHTLTYVFPAERERSRVGWLRHLRLSHCGA